MTTYRIPRYLGLSKFSKTAATHTYSLGYSRQLRRELEVDETASKLLKACLKPVTIDDLVSETSMTYQDVTEAVSAFESAGIIKQIPEVAPEMQRYDRHLLFFDLQGANAIKAQERISNAKVALIGMGGIGSWVSLGLIGAGFKELKLIDFDVIELSNLTRQVLYTEADIGSTKTSVAADVLRARNSQTLVTPIELQVSGVESLETHLADVDFVVVSADRPAKIHDWVDEICIAREIPYLNLGYRDGSGVIGPMTLAGETSCYQCFKHGHVTKESEMVRTFESRYQAPSFGPLNSMVSSIGVMEVIKHISGIGECRSKGVELEVNPMTLEISETPYERDLFCEHCGQ